MFQCAEHTLFSPISTSHWRKGTPADLALQLEFLPWPCLLLCSCIYRLWYCDSSFIFDHSLFLGLKPDLASKAQLLTCIPGIHLFFPPVSVISQLFWGTLYPCFPKLFLPLGPHFYLCSCLAYQILNHSGPHCCFSSLTPWTLGLEHLLYMNFLVTSLGEW